MSTMFDELKEGIAGKTNDIVRDVVVPRAVRGLSEKEREKLRDDVEVIKRLITSAHEPRIALVGSTEVPLETFLQALFGEELPDDVEIKEHLGHGRWYTYPTSRGEFRLLDARTGPGEDFPVKAFDYEAPDVIVSAVPAGDEDVGQWVTDLIRALDRVEDEHMATPATIAAIVRTREDEREISDFKTQQALKEAFLDAGMPRDFVPVISTARPGKLIQTMLTEVSDEIRFPLARLTDDTESKRKLADQLIRMCASANGTIATIPLPLASTLPITSIQVLMIGGIAYIGGRDLSVKTVTEFSGAMGLNVGAGLAFRELARLLIQLIPVAGSVVSASIAAGATYTLGKTAVRYFLTPGE